MWIQTHKRDSKISMIQDLNRYFLKYYFSDNSLKLRLVPITKYHQKSITEFLKLLLFIYYFMFREFFSQKR